jgi:hypothetical protein
MTLLECSVMQEGTQYYKLQIQTVWDVTCFHWMDNSQNFESGGGGNNNNNTECP